MNDLKPYWLGIICCEILGYSPKELKVEADKCSFHSVSEEQLCKMLNGEITMPWRLKSLLSDFALMEFEGWEELQCEPDEVYAKLSVHVEWHLNNKKKHIHGQKRLEALIDEHIDIVSVE